MRLALLQAKLSRLVDNSDTRIGRIFGTITQCMIIVSLVSFSIRTLPKLPYALGLALHIIEWTTVLYFTVEYSMRLLAARQKLKYVFSFYGIIDLLSFLPFYIFYGLDLRTVKIFRLFRLFHMFKLFRYNRAVRRFHTAYMIIKQEMFLFFMTMLFVIYVSAVGIYYFEHQAQPEQFKSIFHSLWWSVVTLTTVGYGDAYPVTIGGRLFTFVILLVGLGVVAVPSALIASALSKTLQEEDEENDES